jgi:Flp pilus assembly CpaE family ATPase
VIVNRYHGGEAISLKDIERTLGLKVYHTLSNDYEAVITAVNSGKPLILSDGSSKYAKDLKALGSHISGLRPERSRLRIGNPFRSIWQKVHHTNGKGAPADE